MNHQKFKKDYSFYRKVNRNFRIKLETSNWPCGYDDMMCERFDDHNNDWLDKHPIIKAVVDNIDSGDYLKDRKYRYFSLKDAIKARL